MAVRPEDFPHGTSETRTKTGFTRVLFDLDYGGIYDAGIADYGEFFTNLEYGWDLLQQQRVPFDNGAGFITVAARYENAVQLKWHPSNPRWRWPR